MTTDRRRNVTTACRACRERKTKCDGGLPKCASCVRQDRSCNYEEADRRRLSLPPTIGILRERIATLTKQLRAAGISPTPVRESDAEVADKVLAGLSLAPLSGDHEVDVPLHTQSDASSYDQPLQSPSSLALPAFPDLDDVSANNTSTSLDVNAAFDDFNIDWNDSPASLDWLWAGPFVPDLETPFTFAGSTDLPSVDQQSLSISGSNVDRLVSQDRRHEEDPESEFASQIAARFGSLHVVGSTLRYFGTTANAHLFSGCQSDGQYVKLRTMSHDGARLLQDADLDAHVDPNLEQDLVEYFFAWHNSCHYVVDRSVHENARKQYATGEDCKGLYSPVLMNAM